ncbi:uncharacterized protein [Miscanthus floridulus]|uniref:uncharacterized protein n=1 Tax=Miscanthus floridulus TaxID=154761 RepID=UPI0034593F43
MAVAAPAPGEATPSMVGRVCPRRGHTCSSSPPLLLLAPRHGYRDAPLLAPLAAATRPTRRCAVRGGRGRMRSTGRATSTGPVRPAPASPRMATPPPASRARPRYPQPRLSADRGTPSHTGRVAPPPCHTAPGLAPPAAPRQAARCLAAAVCHGPLLVGPPPAMHGRAAPAPALPCRTEEREATGEEEAERVFLLFFFHSTS